MTEVLGARLQVAGWALRGMVPPEQLAEILRGAVLRMGMSTGGMQPTVYQYPLPSGKGGVGHTLFLPLGDMDCRPGIMQRVCLALARLLLRRQRFASMIVQPLVESFIVADTYPELDVVYVLAASCREFQVQTVTRYLTRRIGPVRNLQTFEL